MWLVVPLIVSILFIIVSTAWLKLHPFFALLLAAFGFGILGGLPLDTVVAKVNEGFGNTMAGIGIVIIAGTLIGVFLERSGGARQLAVSVLKLTGKQNTPLAMGLIGYVVSLPVFCDSGFIILSPLNRALSKAAGKTVAVGAIALSLGLYATHTMVPPTPGPVAAAALLDADLGRVIAYGLVISLAAMIAGLLFALRVGSKVQIDADSDRPVAASADAGTADHRPHLLKAILPIAMPLVLIVLRSAARLPQAPFGEAAFIQFIGQPAVAMLIGVATALLLPKKTDRSLLSADGWAHEAMVAASSIIFITCAGGAFGKVLQASELAGALGQTLETWPLGIWLPFLIAAAMKTAQGSSTVAIMTTAGLIAPLLGTLGLEDPAGRALCVIAIGAGSMVVSHVNDSYFWVVTRFSGMSVSQGIKLQTAGTLVEGLTAATAVWIMSLILL